MLLKEGRNGGRPAHCVGMVRAPETVEVANFLIDRMGRGTLTAELLQPDELVAGIIAQVRSARPLLTCFSAPVEGLGNPPDVSAKHQEAFMGRVCSANRWRLYLPAKLSSGGSPLSSFSVGVGAQVWGCTGFMCMHVW